jgi:ribonuclease HII
LQLRHLTVEQIKAWINQEPGLTEQDIAELEMDPRVSVRRLAACCRHRQASLRQEEARLQELARQEEELHRQGIFPVAGIDEAGRGALAGPLVVAAVMFPPGVRPAGLNDSKQLTGKQRQLLYEQIKQTAADVAVVIVDREVIDRLNILRATWQAMTEAVGKLRPRPQHCLVDGNQVPALGVDQTAIVGGDGKCLSIAAASIVAKVVRDNIMLELGRRYPQYGFARHKGYCTREHMRALKAYGPCPEHRRSFQPVNDCMTTQLTLPWDGVAP